MKLREPRRTASVRTWSSWMALVWVLAGAGTAEPQQVLVLDESGAGDHLDLASAVAAAADGDTILVRPGDYTTGQGLTPVPPVEVVGTSLVIVGDDADPPTLPPVIARDLASDQSLTLADVILQAGTGTLAPPSTSPALEVVDCAGSVWVQDATLTGGTPIAYFTSPDVPPGTPGLSVSNSHAVTVIGCILRGGDGSDFPCLTFGFSQYARAGGPGLQAVDAAVSLHASVLEGGTGGTVGSCNPNGRAGGAGVHAEDSDVVLTACSLIGGDGGGGCRAPGPVTCRGGDGLELVGTSWTATRQSTFSAGAGGALTGGGTGDPGQDQTVPPGASVTTWTSPARGLLVGSPVVENTVTTIRYEGQQGDTFGLFFAYAPGSLPLYGKQGVFALGIPFVGPTLVWTVTAPDGVFEVPFTAWDLTPFPFDAGTIYGQCFVAPTSGPTVLGDPAALTILDDAL